VMKQDFWWLIIVTSFPGWLTHSFFPVRQPRFFSSDDQKNLGWKVVLRKEARSKREVVNTTDVFIMTTSEATGLVVPTKAPPQPQPASLLGAIELTVEENLLATATY
jgi:hypothetical protein